MTTAQQAADGSVIEFFVKGHGSRLGMVDNIPPCRVVARVAFKKDDASLGLAVITFDADGSRIVIPGDKSVTVLQEKAQAGWGSL